MDRPQIIAAIASWWRRKATNLPEQKYTSCNVIGVGGRELSVEEENDKRMQAIFEDWRRQQLTEVKVLK